MAEFTLDHVRLYFEDQGPSRGAPLVLVHGYPLAHQIWDAVVDLLKEECRLIRPDLRGFGQSQSTAGTTTMDRMADDLAGLLDHLEIAQAVLAGHSMGGYVCMAFARRHPARLAGLGLVATVPTPDTPERAQERRKIVRVVEEKGIGPVADDQSARLTADPVLQECLHGLIEKNPPEGVIGALLGMAERPDSTETLRNIQVPVVVVGGTQDAYFPVEKMRDMASLPSRSRWFEIPDVGHMPMMETPRVVAEALRVLLAEVEGSK